VSLIIGSILGEFFAGKASDILMAWLAKRNNNERKPEYRLYLSPLSAIFMPVGLIIFGATVGKKSFYVPLVGLGVGEFSSLQLPPFEKRVSLILLTPGVFGLQIASTCLYSYVSDCYKPQTPESGVLFNLSRGLSFVIGFFALPFADKYGYLKAWSTFAAILFSFFLPIVALIIWGGRWRKQLGAPSFHRYL
jgi:hypothetical protein